MSGFPRLRRGHLRKPSSPESPDDVLLRCRLCRAVFASTCEAIVPHPAKERQIGRDAVQAEFPQGVISAHLDRDAGEPRREEASELLASESVVDDAEWGQRRVQVVKRGEKGFNRIARGNPKVG